MSSGKELLPVSVYSDYEDPDVQVENAIPVFLRVLRQLIRTLPASFSFCLFPTSVKVGRIAVDQSE